MPRNVTITDVRLRGIVHLVWDAATQTVQVQAEYTRLDAGGTTYGTGHHTMTLTPAQETTLRNFITNSLLPAIRVAEGV